MLNIVGSLIKLLPWICGGNQGGGKGDARLRVCLSGWLWLQA
jgi:hypothetical protein